ncbi:MAG: hypothetical protein K2J52_01375 [Duncaniella sp.]|nr:hypothetical protein [Duncaniella sp.]
MKALKGLMFLATLATLPAVAQNTFDNQYRRPLGEVLDEISKRFNVKIKYNVDTTGLVLPYADTRIRPYSVEETFVNVLSPFDMKAQKQSEKSFKIKYYEPARRTDSDG